MYTARFSKPRWIERAKDQSLDFPIYYNGTIVPVTSGTFALYNDQRVALVDAQAVTVANNIATYALTAAVVPSSTPLGDNWLEIWALYDSAGALHTFQRDASLVRRQLYPVLTDDDLLRRHTSLADLMRSNANINLQKYIDEAWDTILLRMMEDGRYPYLVLSPWSLRAVHMYMSLHLVFVDASTYMDGSSYDQLAERYAKMYEDAWGRLKFTYDYDESGYPTEDKQGTAEQPIIYLGGSPNSRYYNRVR